MKKPVLKILLIILAIAVIGGGIYLASIWNKPLAEAIDLPTRPADTATTYPLEQNTGTESAQTPADVGTPSVDVPTPTTAFTPTKPKALCGGPDIMYILAMGIARDDYIYGLADMIRLVRVDFVTPRVTVMTLPRDLWVEIPDIIDAKRDSVPMQKINTAYNYGTAAMGYYEGPGGGPGLLARTIAYNYDFYVDHYAGVNFSVFDEIVDAMGGVDIYLTQDLDGRPYGMDDVDPYTQGQGYFKAGWNHLSGFDALSFVRIRSRYTETIRTENQTLVMCAIQEKLNRSDIIKSVPKMILALLDDVQTDLTVAQISQLICLLPKLDRANIEFYRLPDEWLVQGTEYDERQGGNTFVWKVPPENIVEYLNAFEADTLEPSPEAATICPVNPPRE